MCTYIVDTHILIMKDTVGSKLKLKVYFSDLKGLFTRLYITSIQLAGTAATSGATSTCAGNEQCPNIYKIVIWIEEDVS